jgi:hypothetical protein
MSGDSRTVHLAAAESELIRVMGPDCQIVARVVTLDLLAAE